MVKVEYRDIAEGGALHFLIEVEGKKMVVFPSKLKPKYKKFFGKKGISIFRLNGSESIKYANLCPAKMGGGAKKDKSTPLFGELPNVFKP